MRHKSVELMNSIQEFVEKYYLDNRHSPSTTEIAEAVNDILQTQIMLNRRVYQ